MLYHKTCTANEAKEFGWPLECTQAWSTGIFEYRCPACNELFSFTGEERIDCDDVEYIEDIAALEEVYGF